MGTDKALLPWDGVPLVVRVASVLAGVVDEVVVVTRRPEALGGLDLVVVADEPGPQTPLAGVVTALRRAGGRPVVVVACDMPHVAPAFVRGLLGLAPGHDAAVPVRDGRPEPLHAVWMPSALPHAEAALASPSPAPRDVLGVARVRWVPEEEWRPWDPEGRSLVNVNTPEDLRDLRG